MENIEFLIKSNKNTIKPLYYINSGDAFISKFLDSSHRCANLVNNKQISPKITFVFEI
jgi:hypothetical protein